MRRAFATIVLLIILLPGAVASVHRVCAQERIQPPVELADYFLPPEKYRNDFGAFRSPLRFNDGSTVKIAQDWKRRRSEIIHTWHKEMGPWPALIDNPKVETVKVARRDNITQHQLRLGIALDGEMVD